MKIAYEATNDNPRVFVAYGNNPAEALKNMYKMLKRLNIDWWSASHVGYIEDENLFYINIYV
jgi:hypothetical protein